MNDDIDTMRYNVASHVDTMHTRTDTTSSAHSNPRTLLHKSNQQADIQISMNDDERKVVAETARMERATGECLHDIERRLEETTSIAHATGSSLKENTSRLHKNQDAAETLMSSTKATHKLLNRLRRWGASDHVGRHHSTQKEQGGTDTCTADEGGGVDGDTAKVERLLHDLDETKDIMREEVEDQRKSIKRLEVAADSVAGIAAAKRRGSAASSSSSAHRISGTNNRITRSEEKSNKAEDEATLDRIGDLLDGLQDHAKDYTEILDAQSKDLEKIDNTMESALQSMKRASQRLKKSR